MDTFTQDENTALIIPGHHIEPVGCSQCKEPSKALPIGIVGSLVVVTTFYILASLTLTLMVPVEAIDASAGGRSILCRTHHVTPALPTMLGQG